MYLDSITYPFKTDSYPRGVPSPRLFLAVGYLCTGVYVKGALYHLGFFTLD